MDQNDKKQVVHMKLLKRVYNQNLWKHNSRRNTRKKAPRRATKHADPCDEDELGIGSLPLQIADDLDGQTSREILPDQILYTPDPTQQVTDTPNSGRTDPSYCSSETPRSRRELQMTRPEPPVTRSRAKIMSQDANV